MKRLLILIVVVALSVGLYAATAGGGQQAVTPKQFAALKKQVVTLQKQVKLHEQAINVLGICDFDSAIAVTSAPSIHVTAAGEATDTYVVTTTKECADAMNSTAFRALLRQARR
jgi:hypothetical protein